MIDARNHRADKAVNSLSIAVSHCFFDNEDLFSLPLSFQRISMLERRQAASNDWRKVQRCGQESQSDLRIHPSIDASEEASVFAREMAWQAEQRWNVSADTIVSRAAIGHSDYSRRRERLASTSSPAANAILFESARLDHLPTSRNRRRWHVREHRSDALRPIGCRTAEAEHCRQAIRVSSNGNQSQSQNETAISSEEDRSLSRPVRQSHVYREELLTTELYHVLQRRMA